MLKREVFKWTTFAMALFVAAANVAVCAGEQAKPLLTPAARSSSHQTNLPNGLYLVVRESDEKRKVEPVGSSEQLFADDYRYLEPAERGPTRYLVVQKKPYVPLLLASSPAEDKEEGTGKPRLQLQLAEEQAKPLEDFTRAHLGETVAIVIGGDVVTTHKVRTAITGGRLQVTRCTEHGCDVLFTTLLGKSKENSESN